MKATATLVLCGSLAAWPLGVAAESKVEVGRVKVVLAEEGWTATEVASQDVGVDHGVSGMIRGKTKVLVLAGTDGKPLATVLIYATWGSNMSLLIQSQCPPGEALYVRDFTKGRNAAPECLRVAGPLDGEAIIPVALRRLGEARQANPIDIPTEAYLVVGNFAASNGAIIDIEALIDAKVLGLATRPQGDVPVDMAPGIAAWGDALGEAARSALRSMSGELRVPPVTVGAADVTPR